MRGRFWAAGPRCSPSSRWQSSAQEKFRHAFADWALANNARCVTKTADPTGPDVETTIAGHEQLTSFSVGGTEAPRTVLDRYSSFCCFSRSRYGLLGALFVGET